MSDEPKAAIAVISDRQVRPDNPETRQMFGLIGQRLTRIELREAGEVFLEFEPYGSLTISPKLTQEVCASLLPGRTQ